MDLEESKEITFYIHEELITVKTSDVRGDTSLNKYLRDHLYLKGTKYLCNEGGCGTCIVGVTTKDPLTNKEVSFSVNSCLVPLVLCQSWKISTIEGIGNSKIGYNKVQKTLANFNGSQCGYCSPGMIMNMYSLLKKNPSITMKEMENSFGGNLCRCTGYRPILTAFKTLCSDKNEDLIGKLPEFDIEDLQICQNKGKTPNGHCQELCEVNCSPVFFNLGASKWYKVFTIDEIFKAFARVPTGTYILLSGNTASGVYKRSAVYDLYIDITSVKELKGYTLTGSTLTLGANITMTDTIELFYKIGREQRKFRYLTKMADHIDLVAHISVRNIGTLAGNLSLKKEYQYFISDIFILLEAANAKLTIVESSSDSSGVLNYLSSFVYSAEGAEMTIGVEDLLTFDMNRKVIKNIILPAYDENYYFDSYKIMPRSQNSQALVNAAFLLQLEQSTNKVLSSRIVYGAINPKFVHAKETEKYLVGKMLFDNETLQGAFSTLDAELKPDYIKPDPTPEFRKKLSISLLYKFILSIIPLAKVSPRNKSGGDKLKRPVSSGIQDYKTNTSLYPVGQPIPKVEALAQSSGKAEYIIDLSDEPIQYFAAFVLADAPANSVIESVDNSKAMKLEGVIAYFDKDDIPGKNTFTGNYPVEETLFCKGTVEYYHQPIGIIVAKSTEVAEKAAELVKVKYTPGAKPLLTVREILKAKNDKKITNEKIVERTRSGTNIKKTFKGTFDIGWQYHFHMETQICSVLPKEDGLEIYAGTQHVDFTQNAVAIALNIPVNKIDMSVRRLGGGFGAKITRNALVTTACALAAYKLHKPVKLIMPLTHNMNVMGRRFPMTMDYEVKTDDNGVIQEMDCTYYNDYGQGGNEMVKNESLIAFTLKYKPDTWKISVNTAKTDTAPGTWARGPGNAEGTAAVESLLEHIAFEVDKDPLEVRLANLNNDTQQKLIEFIKDFRNWADYDKRRSDIAEFNKANRWVKKGICVVPNNYNFVVFGNWTCIVSIYSLDGTVAVSHGGIEMGQGINTKAIQACAYALGIPLEKVSVKPTNNLVSANTFFTGGSITSEAICYSILQACEILNARINPFRMDPNEEWTKVIRRCYENYVDLTATYMYTPKSPGISNYNIYGVCATEVMVDILTGNYLITRVDLLEDTGDSINPTIDIGQIEGAFIMGMGYHTCEEMKMTENGKILTNRTWTYKIPGAKDIPIDFRVKIPPNNPNQFGVLKSKAVGEPPLVLSISVPLAIRNAVGAARLEASQNAKKWYPINGPSTVENTFLNCLHDYKQYTI